MEKTKKKNQKKKKQEKDKNCHSVKLNNSLKRGFILPENAP